jgi:hypothetical protein
VADASYSPRLRTALVLTGAGTAGAYQAGVIRALSEAGTKIDLIGAHGPGIANACIASVDGGQKLGEPGSPWASATLLKSYRWRAGLRAAAWGVIIALATLLLPLVVLVVAAMFYAASLLAGLVSLETVAAWLISAYSQTLGILFNPPILPTVVPRLVVLSLLVTAGILVGAWFRARRARPSRRRVSGGVWWQLVGAPIDAGEPASTLVDAVWTMVRGAATGQAPANADVGRRYVELLSDNFGQPGFCEVVVAVHDLDARRDLAFAVIPDSRSASFAERRPVGGVREAEAVNLIAAMRDYVADLIAAGAELPGVTAGRSLTFPADHYWQGETHRLTDRAELVHRLIDEVLALGAEQIILVSAAPPPGVPHAIGPRPIDLKGRAGEWQRSIETAVIDDAIAHAATRFSGVFVVRPAHNAIGPFQFQGAYDESSDRQRASADLVRQGYDDANRLFVEPVLASGDRVGSI